MMFSVHPQQESLVNIKLVSYGDPIIFARQALQPDPSARRSMAWATRPDHTTNGAKRAALAPSMATRVVPLRIEQMG